MAGRYSILWENERGVLTREEKDEGRRVITDLQLDRAFRLICPDNMIREAFLSVLLTPLTEVGEIEKRRAVVGEFHRSPGLLDKLTELIRRLAVTKNSWDSERSRLMASRRVDPKDKSLVLWVARENLVLTAHFVRIGLRIAADIHETLNMFGCTDGWLGQLKEAARLVGCSVRSGEMTELCDKLEKGLSNAHTYEIEFDFDDLLRITPTFLRDFQYVRVAEKPQKKPKNPLFSLFEKSEKTEKTKNSDALPEMPEREVPLTGPEVGVEWGLELSAKAVQELDRYLTSFLRTLFDRFSGLEEELYFYQAVNQHIDRLAERNVTTVFAELLPAEENRMEMEELSDLLLLTESMSALSVIPNDVSFGGGECGVSGMLITGKNNTGKTVYLRSVGTAVLLTQCGLPIPARSARISVRNRIFTSFAKAEGELIPLSSAGRFEEEVAELSGIIERMEPDSLLLLNETFQTTAYDEGAEGMYHILNYLARLECGFLFVTHLTKLRELYRGESGVTVKKTSDDPRTRYKIETIET